MRVQARRIDLSKSPEHLKHYVKPGQIFVTAEKEYDVHAIALFECILFLQIVDDLGYPQWEPSWLFNVRDTSLPVDWVCNLFQTELAMILGPEFVARDEDTYRGMVELDDDQVERFWKRLHTLKDTRLGT